MSDVMYRNISVEELIEWCQESNPDKMLLDDFETFHRGKLAGKVELIESMVAYLTDTDEEKEDG